MGIPLINVLPGDRQNLLTIFRSALSVNKTCIITGLSKDIDEICRANRRESLEIAKKVTWLYECLRRVGRFHLSHSVAKYAINEQTAMEFYLRKEAEAAGEAAMPPVLPVAESQLPVTIFSKLPRCVVQ